MLQKIIKLPIGLKFSLIKTESSNLLVFRLPSDVRKKILIPKCLNISKDNIFLVVTFKGITKGDVQKYNAFISILFNFLRFLETPFKKQLSLKGLGFKSELLDNGNILELKLGLSHTVRVKVPSNEVKLEVNIILLMFPVLMQYLLEILSNQFGVLKCQTLIKAKDFGLKVKLGL
jgi:ribosomal protein L6P/L9E